MSPAKFGSPVNRLILRGALAVSATSVVLRLLGLVKNQLIAAEFGVSAGFDAFVFAAILPTFLQGVLANALATALIPARARVEKSGGAEGVRRFIGEVWGWCLALLAALTVLLACAWPLFLATAGARFDAEKSRLATHLFFLLLPSFFAHGVAAMFVALLQAQKRFLASVIAPGVVPVTISGFVLFLGDTWDVYSLAAGHTLGVLLELAWLAATTRGAFSVRLRLLRPSSEATAFLRQYAPLLGSGFLINGTMVVDQSMASWLPEGALGGLAYAHVIVAAVLTIGVTGLGTVILPYLSEMAAAEDRDGLKRSLATWVAGGLAVGVLVSGVLVVFADEVAALLYERRAFGAEDTRSVGKILRMYALQIPFYAVGALFGRTLSALNANGVLVRVSFLGLLANAALNLFFMPRLGASGIALSTSLVFLLSSVLLGAAAFRRLSRRGTE